MAAIGLDRTRISGFADLVGLLKDAAQPRTTPVVLAGGGETDVYLDVKAVLDTGAKVRLAVQCMYEWLTQLSMRPTAIGGPTMGADAISHGMVTYLNNATRWFSVRSTPNTSHGLGKWVEGATLGPGDQVLLTDDVASTGNSLVDAYGHVTGTGASVLAVIPLVDRSGAAGNRFTEPYYPLITYSDIGIDPIPAPGS